MASGAARCACDLVLLRRSGAPLLPFVGASTCPTDPSCVGRAKLGDVWGVMVQERTLPRSGWNGTHTRSGTASRGGTRRIAIARPSTTASRALPEGVAISGRRSDRVRCPAKGDRTSTCPRRAVCHLGPAGFTLLPRRSRARRLFAEGMLQRVPRVVPSGLCDRSRLRKRLHQIPPNDSADARPFPPVGLAEL